MATQETTHIKQVVSANIARARHEAGLTQQQLATRLGTSTSRISGWEQGHHLPGGKHRAGLADALFESSEAAMFRYPDEEPATA